MKTHRPLAWAVPAVVGGLLVLPSAPAAAWCQMLTCDQSSTCDIQPPVGQCPGQDLPVEPLHWERACISYAIDEQIPPELDLASVQAEADEAFGTWMSAECPGGGSPAFQVRQIESTATCNRDEFNTDGGNVNVIAFVSDWAERGLEGVDRIYALTTVWHNTETGKILDADMLINEQQGPYAVCPDAGCPTVVGGRTPVDLRNVITHEAGHFFGLAHSDLAFQSLPLDQWPTMGSSAPRGVTFMRSLAPDDIEGFCTVYPSGTPAGTCATNADFEPIGGLDLSCPVDHGGCSVSRGPGAAAGGDGTGVALGLLALLFLWARAAISLRRRRPRPAP